LMAVIQTVTVFLYFWGVRPVRGMFSEWAGRLIFNPDEAAGGFIQSVVREGITIHTTYSLQSTELIFSYAPQFGFFFLIAVVGLNFLRPGGRIYLLLVLFHLFVEALSLGFSALAFNGVSAGFVMADFLLQYLSPLVSLAFILFVLLKKKGKI